MSLDVVTEGLFLTTPRCESILERMSVWRSISALLCGVCLANCAIASTGKILKGATSIEVAEHAEAEKYAVYELTRAREYLHKAREEWGYSDFEAAEVFADQATQWADKARDKARDHDQPKPTPPPAPAPAQQAPAAQQPAPQPVIVPVAPTNNPPPAQTPPAQPQGN